MQVQVRRLQWALYDWQDSARDARAETVLLEVVLARLQQGGAVKEIAFAAGQRWRVGPDFADAFSFWRLQVCRLLSLPCCVPCSS